LNAKLNFDIGSELTHEGFGTNVPSLYLQVCVININPNKYDNFHIHMDYVILYRFMEGK